ncbi:phenylacetate--CoA ligase family protein [Clostridium sp. DJ247]|uniref:phenylacetate--CoA ligase family protein n=1 Tax=Clostridium sp. DJ247 TaxID=2726188 RepID=UPI0016244DD3|nr:AMP-binding protein [Clostridium sp. DJ247]MBC2581753.1 phenylacetate--CoA ligase family protein [Clostridium sp. DJ247]
MKDEELIKSALKSKFYQNKLRGLNLEMWDDIPITSKQELRECNAYDLMGIDFNEIATYHETSGTTGTPTPSWYSFKDSDQEAEVVINSDLKLCSQDLLLNRFPFALAVPSFILFWACQKVKAGHIAVSKATSIVPHARVVEIITRAHPTIIAMLPSEAEIIAEAAYRKGINLPTPNLRALLLAGELISDARKKYLEKLWGVPVFCLFGSTETGGLFMTCKNGHYHINHPKVKIETVDSYYRPLGANQKGYCVLSSAREGMPLLKYFNHDIIEIRDNFNCDCGDNSPILIHYGREDDLIRIKDKQFTFEDVQTSIYSMPTVPFLWRINVYEDCLLFEYQLSKKSSDLNFTEKDISEYLSGKLGVTVVAKYTELIAEESLINKPAYAKFSYMVKHENSLRGE